MFRKATAIADCIYSIQRVNERIRLSIERSFNSSYKLVPNCYTYHEEINLPKNDLPLQGKLLSMDGRVSIAVNIVDSEINLNYIPNGFYLLKINLKGEEINLRLIKQE